MKHSARTTVKRAIPIFGGTEYYDDQALGALGDVTGDGLGDILITEQRRGWARIVPGRRDKAHVIDLRHRNIGIRLRVPNGYPARVASTAPAGDVDRDGSNDALIALNINADDDRAPDRRYVVLFGPVSRHQLDVLQLGRDGMAIREVASVGERPGR